MSLTTRFNGASLPAEWIATVPTGCTVDVQDSDHLRLSVGVGLDTDSIFSATSEPTGPYVLHDLDGGDFDLAMQFRAEMDILTYSGVDLLVFGDDTAGTGHKDAVRAGLYVQGTHSDVLGSVTIPMNTYVYQRYNGSGSAPAINTWDMNEGHGSWLRLKRAGTSWTFYLSASGRTGDWITLATFTNALTPRQFGFDATTASHADATYAHDYWITRIVDLLALGSDDAAGPTPQVTRTTTYTADLSGTSLPAGLTARVNTAAGGSLVVANGYARLTTHVSTADSYAGFTVDTSPGADQGMLMKYRVPTDVPNAVHAYFAPYLRLSNAPVVPGWTTDSDLYSDGCCYLSLTTGSSNEVWFSRKNAIRIGAASTEWIEPYTDMYTVLGGFPWSNPWSWVRYEAIGSRIRIRRWADGDPEPTTWAYDIDDPMIPDGGIGVTLAHDPGQTDDTDGSIDIASFEAYSLATATTTTPTVRGVIQTGVEQPATLRGVVSAGVEVAAAIRAT